MSDREVKAILFDLGETLLNFGRIPVGSVLRQAAHQSYTYLKDMGQPVGGFGGYFWRNLIGLRIQYIISGIRRRDFDSLAVLKKNGEKRGIKLSQGQWEEFDWLWYEPVRRAAWTEPDITQTLGRLKDAGLKLAIVSNTFVNSSALDRHLDEEGLTDFFEFRMYSYQFAFRKPDKRIFLAAAERIGVEPANIMFIGDRIDNDVKGAMRAGMQPVLKKAYTNQDKRVPAGIVQIEKISELPGIIHRG